MAMSDDARQPPCAQQIIRCAWDAAVSSHSVSVIAVVARGLVAPNVLI